jgi:hypothetical protein
MAKKVNKAATVLNRFRFITTLVPSSEPLILESASYPKPIFLQEESFEDLANLAAVLSGKEFSSTSQVEVVWREKARQTVADYCKQLVPVPRYMVAFNATILSRPVGRRWEEAKADIFVHAFTSGVDPKICVAKTSVAGQFMWWQLSVWARKLPNA